MLAEIEHDDPEFAFPAAQLAGFYRRPWELCVSSKHINCQKIERSNQILKEADTHLGKERGRLELHHDNQLSRLRFSSRH
ncbi:hypothetical protein PITC_022420 [Penicillium italicum]|uniref:Uncharacterized protein n=1 Tax=Penicillium italicum TaxID=40296 RepID=A0A0A2K976_PENIT|nr:hypothetical protein PITC_022420 [Penicillium italicum]